MFKSRVKTGLDFHIPIALSHNKTSKCTLKENNLSLQIEKKQKHALAGSSTSFFKVYTSSKPMQGKKMKASKSCAKGFRSRLEERAENGSRNLLKSMQIPDAISTLKKVSEILHQVKKSNDNCLSYNTCSGQHKSAASRKSLNTTMQKRAAQSMKRKQSQHSKRPSLVERDCNKKPLHSLQLIANLGKEKGKGKQSFIQKFDDINETFSEVIELSSDYKNILRQIQKSLQQLFSNYDEQAKDNFERTQIEVLKSKSQLDSLQSENERLRKENEVLKESAKQAAAESEKQRTALKMEINTVKKQANKKIKDISHDLAVLYNENKELSEVAESLYAELQQSKGQKKVIKKCIKVNSEGGVQEQTKKLSKTVVEVGKNNIKIPTLDLSSLITKKKAMKLKVVEYCKNEESDAANEENSNEGKGINHI